MLFKSATSRNMALIAGSGLIATVAATGLLLSFAYDNIRDASITEMRQIAGSYAADIERSMSTGVELTANGISDRRKNTPPMPTKGSA